MLRKSCREPFTQRRWRYLKQPSRRAELAQPFDLFESIHTTFPDAGTTFLSSSPSVFRVSNVVPERPADARERFELVNGAPVVVEWTVRVRQKSYHEFASRTAHDIPFLERLLRHTQPLAYSSDVLLVKQHIAVPRCATLTAFLTFKPQFRPFIEFVLHISFLPARNGGRRHVTGILSCNLRSVLRLVRIHLEQAIQQYPHSYSTILPDFSEGLKGIEQLSVLQQDDVLRCDGRFVQRLWQAARGYRGFQQSAERKQFSLCLLTQKGSGA